MKTKAMMVSILLCCLLLAACSGGVQKPEPTPTTIPTPVPTPKVSVFYEDGKAGIKKGDEVIADAIWQEVKPIETSKETVYIVEMNKKYGVMNSEGELIVEPNWSDVKYSNACTDYIIVMEKSSCYIYDLNASKNICQVYSTDGNLSIIDNRYVVYNYIGDWRYSDIILKYTPGLGFYSSYSRNRDYDEIVYDAASKICGKDWTYNLYCILKQNTTVYDTVSNNAIIDNLDSCVFASLKDLKMPLIHDSDLQVTGEFNIVSITPYGAVIQYCEYNDNSLDDVDSLFQWETVFFPSATSATNEVIKYFGKTDNMIIVDDVLIAPSESSTDYSLNLYNIKGDGSLMECFPIIFYEQEKVYEYEGSKIFIATSTKDKVYKDVLINLSNWEYFYLPDLKNYTMFSDGMAAVQNNKDKWGYINTKGELVYDFLFDDAPPFENGKATVIYNYKKVTIDKEGNME